MNSIDRFYTSDPVTFARSYLAHVQGVLGRIDPVAVGRLVTALLEARDRGATIFFIGNGGSASTASHFANDVAVGSNAYARPFRAVSLTDNVAVLTALGNDVGYDEVFVRQLRILGRPGDVLVAISASGNSPNVIKAVEYARSSGITSVALTGFDGGRLRTLADDGVHVPTEPREYGPAEDAHMVLDHLVGAYLARFVAQAAATAGSTHDGERS